MSGESRGDFIHPKNLTMHRAGGEGKVLRKLQNPLCQLRHQKKFRQQGDGCAPSKTRDSTQTPFYNKKPLPLRPGRKGATRAQRRDINFKKRKKITGGAYQFDHTSSQGERKKGKNERKVLKLQGWGWKQGKGETSSKKIDGPPTTRHNSTRVLKCGY